jgi:spore cortex formation protein SpoVR/YcgB (stage V sporulation)
MEWCSVKRKHRDFTFVYLYLTSHIMGRTDPGISEQDAEENILDLRERK